MYAPQPTPIHFLPSFAFHQIFSFFLFSFISLIQTAPEINIEYKKKTNTRSSSFSIRGIRRNYQKFSPANCLAISYLAIGPITLKKKLLFHILSVRDENLLLQKSKSKLNKESGVFQEECRKQKPKGTKVINSLAEMRNFNLSISIFSKAESCYNR